MFDLSPATEAMAKLVEGVRDDQLDAVSPCEGLTVTHLLDHANGLSMAFTMAACKTTPADSGPPVLDGSNMPADWRAAIPAHLHELASAWRTAEAWEGMTRAGGVDMPAEVAATVALDEVVVHGWDIAKATGQDYSVDPELVETVFGWVQQAVEQSPGGIPGLFGPAIRVAVDAPILDRLIGLTGRRPDWRPPAA